MDLPLKYCGIIVGLSGLEPPTSRLSDLGSTKMSYFPFMARPRGVEPLTF
ncbi:hypothetical protein EMIT0180MI3_10518 [Priestia megaterium]